MPRTSSMMEPLLRAGAVLAIALLAPACPSERDRALDALAEARTVAEDEPERAAALLEEAVELHPELHEALGLLAEIRLAQERWSDAERAAAEAARLHDAAGYREVAGDALAGQERWEPAVAQWQRALDLDPARHHLLVSIARAYERLERPREAVRTYGRVLEASEERAGVDAAVLAEACIARVRILADGERWDLATPLLAKCRALEGVETTHADALAAQAARIEAHEAAEAEVAAETEDHAEAGRLLEWGQRADRPLPVLRSDPGTEEVIREATAGSLTAFGDERAGFGARGGSIDENAPGLGRVWTEGDRD